MIPDSRAHQPWVQIAVWQWNPADLTSFLSPELYDLFGIERNDPHSRELWRERVDRDDWDVVESSMREAAHSGKMKFQYRYHHPRNGLRYFHCQGSRLRPADAFLTGVVLDMTNRMEAEEALRAGEVLRREGDEARLKLAAIVESSDDAIVSKDLNGIVTSWNAGAQRIFGFTAEEMVGQSILKIIPPELHHDEDRILSTLRRGERIDHFETVRVSKSGERKYVSLTISPVKDETGHIIGVAKIARDITEKRKADEALRMSERLATAGRLAATMAHEINNPLESVVNLIYLAKDDPGLSEQTRRFLSIADEELARVAHITRQTLGFYRESAEPQLTRLSEIFHSLSLIYEARFRNRNIRFTVETRNEVPVVVKAGELTQVFSNLVQNAMDAVGTGGRIAVRLSACTHCGNGEKGVRVTIADNGIGIPPELRGRLFEPFFTTKQTVGTGLGLWVSKGILEKYHGTIAVHSCTTPGKSGTAVRVVLPVAAALRDEGSLENVGLPANLSRAR